MTRVETIAIRTERREIDRALDLIMVCHLSLLMYDLRADRIMFQSGNCKSTPNTHAQKKEASRYREPLSRMQKPLTNWLHSRRSGSPSQRLLAQLARKSGMYGVARNTKADLHAVRTETF